MPRLPDKSALGGTPSLYTPDRIVTGQQYGAELVPKALGDFGGDVAGAGDQLQVQQDHLDLLKAEGFRSTATEDLVQRYQQDPDYNTFGPRFTGDVNQVNSTAAGMISNPQARQLFQLKAQEEGRGALRRVLTYGTHLARQDKDAQTDDAVGNILSPILSPDITPDQAQAKIDEATKAVDEARKSGLMDPAHAHAVLEKHLHSSNGILGRMAQNRLWSDDPEAAYNTLRDLGVASTAPSDAPETGEPSDTSPAISGPKSGWAKVYQNLSGEARAHLITNARIALRSRLQDDLKGSIEYARTHGELPTDDDGKTVKDRMGRILTPNQVAKGNSAIDAAIDGYNSTKGLFDLAPDDAMTRVAALDPDKRTQDAKASGTPPPASYAAMNKNQQNAYQLYVRAREQGERDPKQYTLGMPLKGPAISTPQIGDDGTVQMVENQGSETGHQIPASPEVSRAYIAVNGRQPDMQLVRGDDGSLTFGPSQTQSTQDWQKRQRGNEDVIDASLAAQKRLGFDTPRTVTRAEAHKLLGIGKGENVSTISNDDLVGRMQKANETAQAQYGKYSRQALKDSIDLVIKSNQAHQSASDLIADVVTGRVDPNALLTESATRAAGQWPASQRSGWNWFGSNPEAPVAQGQRAAELAASGQPSAPSLAIPPAPEMQGTPALLQRAPTMPTQAQLKWLQDNKENVSARHAFDSLFTPGSADYWLKKQ